MLTGTGRFPWAESSESQSANSYRQKACQLWQCPNSLSTSGRWNEGLVLGFSRCFDQARSAADSHGWPQGTMLQYSWVNFSADHGQKMLFACSLFVWTSCLDQFLPNQQLMWASASALASLGRYEVERMVWFLEVYKQTNASSSRIPTSLTLNFITKSHACCQICSSWPLWR